MAKSNIVNLIALGSLSSLVQQWVPGGTQCGKEYVVRNPNRSDNNAGSFSINTETGEWSDFATKEKGTDPISLYAFINRLEYKDAYAELRDKLHITSNTIPPPAKKSNSVWTTVLPVPKDAPQRPHEFIRKEKDSNGVERWEHYPIQLYWEYKNANGELCGYDFRIVNKRDRKEVLPLTYCKNNEGTYLWKFKHFTGKRLLYGLDRVALNPKAIIVIVEGCKCAKALQDILDINKIDTYVAVTWPGGCDSTKKANWNLLKGRSVIIWPDNDRKLYPEDHKDAGKEMPKEEQGGWLAAVDIYKTLKPITPSVKLLDVPGIEKPDTWDVADAIQIDNWTCDEVINYIEQHKIDYKEIQKEWKLPFKFLGHEGDYRYYLTATRKLKCVSENSHTPLTIMNLADFEFWRAMYPNKAGVDWLRAASFLLNHPDAAQAFDPRRRRGRGAYIDNKRIVYHLGDRLLVDNCIMDNFDLTNSTYIYESGVRISDDLSKPLSDDDALKLVTIIDQLHFTSITHGILLAGFLALAPICGALDWRPHIWVTGGKGTGKSAVMEKIVRPCLGLFSLYISLDSTASGIRQTLKLDGMPVIFDENEGQDAKSKTNVQDVLKLARQSSTKSESRVIKGSSSHKAVEFNLHSMFVFSSIGVNISEGADESRISMVEMTVPKHVPQATLDAQWLILEKEIEQLLTPEYCAALRVRSIKNIAIIRENCKIFTSVLSPKLGNKRAGDQLGALFAGAYSLHYMRVATPEIVNAFIKDLNFNTVYEKSADDETKLLDVLLQHTLYVSPSSQLSVEEIIRKIIQKPDSFDGSPDETQKNYYELLKRNGIRIDNVENNATKWYIWISDSHGSIARILENSPWPKKWGMLLKRIHGAETKVIRFIGSPSRATGIPLEKIIDT